MTHNNHRGFTSGYFLFLLFFMVFFGWKMFYVFPFLFFLLWMPWFTTDWYYEDKIEKPKRKPKNDDYTE